MLKSAVLFSHRKIQFHIFTEDALRPEFDEQLRQWPDSYTKKFEHRIYPITFSVGNPQEWKKLFKPCAAQRLFLPVILKDVDSLLYVDTDVLFLRPVDDIWKLLRQFNSTQLAAMAPEHEIPKIGWYSRFARHPFYGAAGVNSGVMLMNLTRIRSAQFKNSVIPTGLAWKTCCTLCTKSTRMPSPGRPGFTEYHFFPSIQSVSMCSPASGTTAPTTACTEATAKRPSGKACPSCMATGASTTTTSSPPSKLSTKRCGTFPFKTISFNLCTTPFS
nr:glucoside xylosyltransferase 2 [Microcebus murinus]